MDDSILKTVRVDGANQTVDCEVFDDQLIPLINTAFSNLNQAGVGPVAGFAIDGVSQTWDDFTTDIIAQGWVKTYVSTYTRLMFDPPSASFVNDSLNRKMDECFFRLNVHCDPPDEEV